MTGACGSRRKLSSTQVLQYLRDLGTQVPAVASATKPTAVADDSAGPPLPGRVGLVLKAIASATRQLCAALPDCAAGAKPQP